MSSRPMALITGAAQGIGLAAAHNFAARGYDLALLDIQAEPLTEAAALVSRTAGGQSPRITVHPGDLSGLAFAESALKSAAAEHGRLDVLVNNAAWRELSTMRSITVDSWEKTLRVCLTAPAFLSRWAAEIMEQQGHGVIVNVSSIRSLVPDGLAAAYSAAKGGLDNLTRDLAALYGRCGIRVVGVNPGAVDTALSRDYADAGGSSITADLRRSSEDAIPLGRWATAEEIAAAITWLASDEARYITGTSLIIDGGWTHNGTPHSLKHRMAPDAFR